MSITSQNKEIINIESKPRDWILIILGSLGIIVGLWFALSIFFYQIIHPEREWLSNKYLSWILFIVTIISSCLVFIELKSRIPMYPFVIYEDGFIYPYKLESGDQKTNFIAFKYIADACFYWFGLFLVIRLKDGKKEIIKSDEYIESYLILCNMLIQRMKQKRYPDLSPLYEIREMKKRGENIDDALHRLMKINEDFKELPKDWMQ